MTITFLIFEFRKAKLQSAGKVPNAHAPSPGSPEFKSLDAIEERGLCYGKESTSTRRSRTNLKPTNTYTKPNTNPKTQITEVFTLPLVFRADSRRTPSDSTYPECQFFGSGMAGIVRWLSGDFPVHPHRTGESDRLSGWTVCQNITKPTVKFHWKWPDNSRQFSGSPVDSNGHQADNVWARAVPTNWILNFVQPTGWAL